MKPRLLDAACCEGGAAEGYHRLGWDVTGVDLNGKYAKRYPFRFVQADAIEYIRRYGHRYDAIHASWPCQRYSITNAARKRDYPDLIAVGREVILQTGKPYVMENVVGSPLHNPIMLCGTMFDLTTVDDDGTKLYLQRHRLFESNVPLEQPPHEHPRNVQWAGSYGGARRDKDDARNVRHGGYVPSKAVQERLLGIDWMTQYGLFQSLPPVYTEFVGRQLLMAVTAA